MTPEGKKKLLFGLAAVAVLGGGWWWWSSRESAAGEPARKGTPTGAAIAFIKSSARGHNIARDASGKPLFVA